MKLRESSFLLELVYILVYFPTRCLFSFSWDVSLACDLEDPFVNISVQGRLLRILDYIFWHR